MQTFQIIIQSELLQILTKFAAAITGVVLMAMIMVLLLHTAHVFGRKTVLYRRRTPAAAWNRPFYASCIMLISLLSILVWILSSWAPGMYD
jgi:hypothetical protein